MAIQYPQHIDHNSNEFVQLQKEMKGILNSEYKGAAISINTKDQTLVHVAFTIDFNDTYYHLLADGVMSKWENVNSKPTIPLYTLSNYRIVSHGGQVDDNISALLAYIFSSDAHIHKKYKEYMYNAVKELRTDKLDTLKKSMYTLLYGNNSEW